MVAGTYFYNTMNNEYIPGVCNIGPDEIKRRIQVGLVGLVATGLLAAALLWFDAPWYARLALFVPAFVASIGFLQAFMHFCVAFGTKGVFNVKNKQGETESVERAEFRKADQKKVIQIYGLSVLTAGVVAFVAIVI
ncbi:MAG: hypothetical protein Q8K68_03945 [Nitrospirota bacterium]|nr:hypothetical protein [Nitrospirota bacterium]